LGRIKDNFDVAVRDAFAVAMISDTFGNIILVANLKLVGSDVLQGEATVARLASILLFLGELLFFFFILSS
jgi:hypothetical protein